MKIRIILYCFIPILFGCKHEKFLFTEVSDDIGLKYHYPGNDYEELGAGIIVIDVNNDGWEDIFQASGIFKSKLWINNNGVFEDKTEDFNLQILDSMYVFGGSSGDYNNDGYTDLFIGNLGIKKLRGDGKPPILLKNVNGEYFEEDTLTIFPKNGSFHGCSWGDVNNDGFIDLYLPNYVEKFLAFKVPGPQKKSRYEPTCLENYFFLNHNGIRFTDATKEYNLNDSGCGLSSCFTDYDNDNDVDLMLVNDFAIWTLKGNRIFKNVGGKQKYEDISKKIGFYDEFYGMGIGPGDMDSDGILDYYLSNLGANRLMKNHIDTIINVSKEQGVDVELVNENKTGTSWSGIFLDINNDIKQDLYVSKGHLEIFENIVVLDENKMFLNKGTHYEDISNISGANDPCSQRGAATLDYDHDGDLDIVVGTIKMRRGEFGKLNQKIKVFRNNNRTKNNWIRIKLIGDSGVNRDCLGCSVTISLENNTKKIIREVDGGSGHSSQSSKILHFGLGSEKFAKNIEIQWLGKETQKIEKLKAGRVYEIFYKGDISIIDY